MTIRDIVYLYLSDFSHLVDWFKKINVRFSSFLEPSLWVSLSLSIQMSFHIYHTFWSKQKQKNIINLSCNRMREKEIEEGMLFLLSIEMFSHERGCSALFVGAFASQPLDFTFFINLIILENGHANLSALSFILFRSGVLLLLSFLFASSTKAKNKMKCRFCTLL